MRVRSPKARELAATLAAHDANAEILGGDQLRITGASSEQIGTLAAEHAIPIYEAATEAPDLEDIFLRLTAAEQRKGKQ